MFILGFYIMVYTIPALSRGYWTFSNSMFLFFSFVRKLLVELILIIMCGAFLYPKHWLYVWRLRSELLEFLSFQHFFQISFKWFSLQYSLSFYPLRWYVFRRINWWLSCELPSFMIFRFVLLTYYIFICFSAWKTYLMGIFYVCSLFFRQALLFISDIVTIASFCIVREFFIHGSAICLIEIGLISIFFLFHFAQNPL